MYRTVLIPLLVALFALNGCDKNSTTTEQPTDELAELRSQLSSCQQQLSAVTDEHSQLQSELGLTRDSLVQALAVNDSLIQRVQDTEAQLAFARSEFKKALAAFDTTLTECRVAKDRLASENILLNENNVKFGKTVIMLAEEIQDLNLTLGATKQWHGYYKTVSERNILKHLFGAGKPPLPDVPDPSD